MRKKDENRTGTKVPDGSEGAGRLIPVVDAERTCSWVTRGHSLPTDSAARGDLANWISFVAFRTGSCYLRLLCALAEIEVGRLSNRDADGLTVER